MKGYPKREFQFPLLLTLRAAKEVREGESREVEERREGGGGRKEEGGGGVRGGVGQERAKEGQRTHLV